MTSKYSKNYKLSITNSTVFEVVKMLISIVIALFITFLILCMVSKDPFTALKTILTALSLVQMQSILFAIAVWIISASS